MTLFLSSRRFALKLYLLFSLLTFSCRSSEKEEELNRLEWLSGRWENEMNGIRTIETWTRKTDKNYLVTGFMLEASDTIFAEKISVEATNSGIIYKVVIADQNDGQPVSFKLTESTNSTASFENPDHDFPQKITYAKITADSVLVRLEGRLKGKKVAETYPLKKTAAQH